MKRIDRFGLHATDCACEPCERGFRPTQRQRQNALLAWEAAERRRKEEKARAAEGAQAEGEKKKRPTMETRLEALEEETKRALAALKPPDRPATADELREMRRAFFPNLKRKGDDHA